MTSTTERLSVGQLVANRYTLEEKLGEGGMAVVFRARHNITERVCALKTIHPSLVSHAEAREQFRREARVPGRLASHPNIVEVFDAGIDEHDIPFIAMELLSGETLGDYRRNHDPLSWDTISLLLNQLGSALDEAHAAGVIHRDLKPGNLFITEDRRGQLVLKVLDFGIAKLLDRERNGNAKTATQICTPWYSAPEQMGAGVRRLARTQGFTISKGVSPATDVWPLGLLALELLAGMSARDYWNAESMGDLVVRLAVEPATPPSARVNSDIRLPKQFDSWFLRCLNQNAALRWPSAGLAVSELLLLLERHQQGPPGAQDDRAALDNTAPLPDVDAAIAKGRAAPETGPASTLTPWLSALRHVRANNLIWRYTALGVAAISLLMILVVRARGYETAADTNSTTLSMPAYSAVTHGAAPSTDQAPVPELSHTIDTPKPPQVLTTSSASPITAEPKPKAVRQPPEGPDKTISTPSPTPRVASGSAAQEPTPVGKFDARSQKPYLYNKALRGRATDAELRLLKGICMRDHDRACRDVATARLGAQAAPPPPPPLPDVRFK